MGKSFLEKMGLVESICEEVPVSVEHFKETAPVVSVSSEPVAITENLAEEIYSANNLTCRDKSIYKVDELLKSLPMEMMEKAKKDTVLNLLKVLMLTVPELISDADNRKAILNAKLDEISSDNTATIEQSKHDIEELKAAIATANQVIEEKEKEIKLATESIEKECAVINLLIEFIGGNVNVT